MTTAPGSLTESEIAREVTLNAHLHFQGKMGPPGTQALDKQEFQDTAKESKSLGAIRVLVHVQGNLNTPSMSIITNNMSLNS